MRDRAPAPTTLRTTRLTLRPVTIDDLDALHALWTDPQVRRYLWDDVVIPMERVAEEIETSRESFHRLGFGMWAAHLSGEPSIAGFCGLRTFGDSAEVEILYGLDPAVWGHGYATEAGREVLRFGFEDRALGRIHGRTDPPNVASQRVLERLGMRFVKRGRLGELEVVEYVLAVADFRKEAGEARSTAGG